MGGHIQPPSSSPRFASSSITRQDKRRRVFRCCIMLEGGHPTCKVRPFPLLLTYNSYRGNEEVVAEGSLTCLTCPCQTRTPIFPILLRFFYHFLLLLFHFLSVLPSSVSHLISFPKVIQRSSSGRKD